MEGIFLVALGKRRQVRKQTREVMTKVMRLPAAIHSESESVKWAQEVTDLDQLTAAPGASLGPDFSVTELLQGNKESHAIDETDRNGIGEQTHEGTGDP